ncbi:hypothetical protein M8456_11320 [Citrobacter portucalensis]|uniref:hypothetical protein n=1 Tax=Citrobacter freundii complex TaxID=1344959 RepID=UPI00200FF23F|nr:MULTISPECIES: hypothetical protein [Citrobacter freundii complex]MCR3695689.1 hypothetical protein [Citrobacter portucalensis]UQI38077.1 hypothetical protein M3L74_10050 [Citrobacter freundii]
MDKQLLKAINRTRHMPIAKDHSLGLIPMLILSKDIFASNSDVYAFLTSVFDMKLLAYASRSRTLMCAKACRYINDLNDEDFKSSMRKFSSFISYMEIEALLNSTDELNGSARKQSAISNMNKWISNQKKD